MDEGVDAGTVHFFSVDRVSHLRDNSICIELVHSQHSDSNEYKLLQDCYHG